jgi:hypothetical protein
MTEMINRDLKVVTEELHAALKREATDIIAIGNLLIEAQGTLKHGEWLPWLKKNFGSSGSTADNYMAAARFATKFPTVGNLRLSPTTLYLLGHDLASPCGLYNRKAINAILSEAKIKWVNRHRAREIAHSLKPQDAGQIEDQDEEAAKAEAEEILEGPPPELPPAPEPTVQDVILPSFNQAIKTLTNLRTKPLEKFADTEHDAHAIRALGDFLHQLADAIDRQQKEGRGSHETKGERRQ